GVVGGGAGGEGGGDVLAQVGGDALEAADGHGLSVHAGAAAGRLARPVAGSPQDARKHVRFAVQDVGVPVSALRDQGDVLRRVRMRPTGPLAIDHAVKIVGVVNVGGTHAWTGSAKDSTKWGSRASPACPFLTRCIHSSTSTAWVARTRTTRIARRR